jgi:hypothetical protein
MENKFMKNRKPQSEICSKCFVTNNALRCMTCKYKTKEWLTEYKNAHSIIMLGEYDNFKERGETNNDRL